MTLFFRSFLALVLLSCVSVDALAAPHPEEPVFSEKGPAADTGIGAILNFNAEMRSQVARDSVGTELKALKEYWHTSGGGYVIGIVNIDWAEIVTKPGVRGLWTLLFIFCLAMYFNRMANPLSGANKPELLAALPLKFLFLPFVFQMDMIYAFAESIRGELVDLVVGAITENVSEDPKSQEIVINEAIAELFATADPARREFELARIEAIAKAFGERSPAFSSSCTGLAAALALSAFDEMEEDCEEAVKKYGLVRAQFDYISMMADIDDVSVKKGASRIAQNNLKNIPLLLYAMGDEIYDGDFPDTSSSGNSNTMWGRVAGMFGFGDDAEEAGYTLSRFGDEPEPLIEFIDDYDAVDLRNEALRENKRTPTSIRSSVDRYRDLIYQATLEHLDQAWLKQMADFEESDSVFSPLAGKIDPPEEIIRIIHESIHTPASSWNPVQRAFEGFMAMLEAMNNWMGTVFPRFLSMMFVMSMEIAVFMVYLTYPLWFLEKSKAFTGWVQTLVTSVLFTVVFFIFVTVVEIGLAQMMSWIENGWNYDGVGSSVVSSGLVTGYAKYGAAVTAFFFRLIFYLILAFQTPKITKKILAGQSFVGSLAMAAGVAAVGAALAGGAVALGGTGLALGAGKMGIAKGGLGTVGTAMKNGFAQGGGGVSGARNAMRSGLGAAREGFRNTAERFSSGVSGLKDRAMSLPSRITADNVINGTVKGIGGIKGKASSALSTGKSLATAAYYSKTGQQVGGALREAAHAAASGGDAGTYMRGRGERWRQNSILSTLKKQANAAERGAKTVSNFGTRNRGGAPNEEEQS
jgi:hypothetical protein